MNTPSWKKFVGSFKGTDVWDRIARNMSISIANIAVAIWCGLLSLLMEITQSGIWIVLIVGIFPVWFIVYMKNRYD